MKTAQLLLCRDAVFVLRIIEKTEIQDKGRKQRFWKVFTVVPKATSRLYTANDVLSSSNNHVNTLVST